MEMTASTDDEATIRTTVSLPGKDYTEIEKIAREKRVSVAWVVREAVAEYLSGLDTGSKSESPKRTTKRRG